MTESRKLSTFNSSYIEDIEYSIQVNRWFLKPIGAWPMFRAASRMKGVASMILNLACYGLIIITIIPSIMFIFLEDTTIETRLKATGPVSYIFMGGLNYFYILSKGKEICQCIDHIRMDWQIVNRAHDRLLMLENAKFGRFIACLAALCMNLGVFLYCILCAVKPIPMIFGNETILMRMMPCPFYTKLVDIRYSPTNEIALAVQFLSCLTVNFITASASGLAAVFTMHACGQLNVLMSWLDEFVVTKEKEECVQNKLASIVKHHLRVLSFVSNIENVLNQICLIKLVECTMNLCMLGYYFITELGNDLKNTISYAVTFLSMTFNIFIFCYIGEILTQQCTEVGKRAYMTDWYLLPHKTAVCLVLIMARSGAATRITAGKMIKLSITTFADVIKSAFGYINLLRTMT